MGTALFGGVLVDRLPRRTLLVLVDMARAVVMGIVPAAAAMGQLNMAVVYGVSSLMGGLTVAYGAAYTAFLPTLVGPSLLAKANSRLYLSQSVALALGPMLAGVFVQRFSAPFTLGADAVSYILAATSQLLTAKPERARRGRTVSSGVLQDVRESARWLWGNRPLLSVTACSIGLGLFSSVMMTVAIPYKVRTLGLVPATLGLIDSVTSLGLVAGSLAFGWLMRLLGLGNTMFWSALVYGVGALALPLARGSVPAIMVILIAGGVLQNVFTMVYHVGEAVFIQSLVPGDLLGRVFSVGRLVRDAGSALGLFLGGLLAAAVGLRGGLFVGAVGLVLSAAWVFGPARRHPPQGRPVG